MREDERPGQAGMIDALARITKELLDTPNLTQALTIILNSIDPPAARDLVRTLLWTDPVLFISLVGALPELVNASLEGAAELAAQLGTLPPPLLRGFLVQVAGRVSGAAAGEAAAGFASLLASLEPRSDEALTASLEKLAADFRAAYREKRDGPGLPEALDRLLGALAAEAGREGSATARLVGELGGALRRNPDFVEKVLRPVAAPLLEALEPGEPADE